jgi:molybdopterin molybdotransferase
LKRIPDNLTPEQAWSHLCSHPPLGIELRAIPDAVGYVLAEPVHAMTDVPVSDRSFMDGYAVRVEDIQRIPARLKLAGEVNMGEQPSRELMRGEALKIPTGGFLPVGANAVVMQEDTDQQNETVVVKRSVQPFDNVQKAGEDFRKGDQLFPALHALRPQDLASLATFGITQCQIYRKARIAIISTGNELVSHTSRTVDGAQIRETNALALSAAACHFHFSSTSLGIISDEFAAQRSAMDAALRAADVVLVSGGSSVGERDYTLEVIRSYADHRLNFHGLAIRPGNPTIFASIGTQYVFGLPGQPVSSLIVFYQFVLPFLMHISGHHLICGCFQDRLFRTTTATLRSEAKKLKNKTDYLRVHLDLTSGNPVAVPVPGKSASLSTLAKADGWIVVPPGDGSLPAGAEVRVYFFP